MSLIITLNLLKGSLLLHLPLVKLRLGLLNITVRYLMDVNGLYRCFLCSLHILEVNVALLGLLHHLLDLLLGEIHLRRRVLVLLGLDHLLAGHSVRALLHDSLLRHTDRGLALSWRLLNVLLSLKILHKLGVVDKARLSDKLLGRFLEILVGLKFSQFIQIVLRNRLLML